MAIPPFPRGRMLSPKGIQGFLKSHSISWLPDQCPLPSLGHRPLLCGVAKGCAGPRPGAFLHQWRDETTSG